MNSISFNVGTDSHRKRGGHRNRRYFQSASHCLVRVGATVLHNTGFTYHSPRYNGVNQLWRPPWCRQCSFHVAYLGEEFSFWDIFLVCFKWAGGSPDVKRYRETANALLPFKKFVLMENCCCGLRLVGRFIFRGVKDAGLRRNTPASWDHSRIRRGFSTLWGFPVHYAYSRCKPT